MFVGLLAGAGGCHAGDDEAAGEPDSVPRSTEGEVAAWTHPLLGTWRIQGRHTGAGAGMSDEDASAWHGRTYRLGEDAMWGPGFRCESVSYQVRDVPADSLLGIGYNLPVQRLENADPDGPGVPDRATLVRAQCGPPAPSGPGGTWIGLSADRALAPWDGVLFELMRVPDSAWVDLRASGQEPGWILELTLGEQVRFLYMYGEEQVSADTPSPRPASGSDGLVFETAAAGSPLRVEIVPEACQDDMSGAAYETRVTVTYHGVDYRGCGGPIPPELTTSG